MSEQRSFQDLTVALVSALIAEHHHPCQKSDDPCDFRELIQEAEIAIHSGHTADSAKDSK